MTLRSILNSVVVSARSLWPNQNADAGKMAAELPLPIIDLSLDAAVAAEAMKHACEEHGFFMSTPLVNPPTCSFT